MRVFDAASCRWIDEIGFLEWFTMHGNGGRVEGYDF